MQLTNQTLQLFQTNKSERESFAVGLLEQMENGDVDPLLAHLQVKSMEDILNRLTDKKRFPETAERYAGMVQSNAERYGKQFDLHNARFQVKDGTPTYDWTACNDPELNRLMAQMEQLKEDVKKRQDFLKNAPASGTIIVDDATGEVITVYPPMKSSGTVVAVTLR